MNDKIIIKVIFPSLSKEYDVNIPVNELVWRVNKLIVKAVYDMNGIKFDLGKNNFLMINKSSGETYKSNDIIIDTNIRTGTEIVFLKDLYSEEN